MPEIDNSNSTRIFHLELIIFLCIMMGIGYFSWQLIPDQTKQEYLENAKTKIARFTRTEKPAPSSDPTSDTDSNNTPVQPLPTGNQTYRFSHGKEVQGPNLESITFSPLTPKLGEEQKIILVAKYETDITAASLEIYHDSGSDQLELALNQGTAKSGTWTGTRMINNPYELTYGIRIILKSNRDSYDNTMWFRH